MLLAAAACTGGSDTVLVLRAETEGLPAGSDLDAAVENAASILRQRAALFGAGEAVVSINGEEITVSISEVGEEIARELLLPRGLLEFRQPVVSDTGFIVCADANGEEFAVHPLRVNPDSASRNPARCFGDSALGEPKWEPTETIFVRTDEFSLAELIEAGSWQIRDRTSLAPQFNEDGAELLEEVTAGLIGYPLGLFVDGELIGAPRIQRAITNGQPVISGFDELEARIRQAQLNASPLPFALVEVDAPDRSPKSLREAANELRDVGAHQVFVAHRHVRSDVGVESA